jgi:RNA polymerase sigma-70 factor (ECF subfamily)
VISESELTEQDAIERYLSAPCEEAFRELFRQLCPKLQSYFRLHGCQPSGAEELTQDVMLTVFRKAHTLKNPLLFRPWLFKIARNQLLQEIRKRGRRIELVELDRDSVAPAPAEADSRFMEWMKWLEPWEQQVMVLRYVEELGYNEIAQVLDIPLGTVQWRIFNSTKKLAARFGRVRE